MITCCCSPLAAQTAARDRGASGRGAAERAGAAASPWLAPKLPPSATRAGALPVLVPALRPVLKVAAGRAIFKIVRVPSGTSRVRAQVTSDGTVYTRELVLNVQIRRKHTCDRIAASTHNTWQRGTWQAAVPSVAGPAGCRTRALRHARRASPPPWRRSAWPSHRAGARRTTG